MQTAKETKLAYNQMVKLWDKSPSAAILAMSAAATQQTDRAVATVKRKLDSLIKIHGLNPDVFLNIGDVAHESRKKALLQAVDLGDYELVILLASAILNREAVMNQILLEEFADSLEKS